MNNTLSKQGFAAVLHSQDGYDWLDHANVKCTQEEVRDHYDYLKRTIPTWCNANRLVRIAKVTVSEVT